MTIITVKEPISSSNDPRLTIDISDTPLPTPPPSPPISSMADTAPDFSSLDPADALTATSLWTASTVFTSPEVDITTDTVHTDLSIPDRKVDLSVSVNKYLSSSPRDLSSSASESTNHTDTPTPETDPYTLSFRFSVDPDPLNDEEDPHVHPESTLPKESTGRSILTLCERNAPELMGMPMTDYLGKERVARFRVTQEGRDHMATVKTSMVPSITSSSKQKVSTHSHLESV